MGDWWGILGAGAQKIHTVLHVVRLGDGTLAASFQSPDQTPASFPAHMTYAGETVTFQVEAVAGTYEASLGADGTLTGTWQQRGFSLPLAMVRGTPPGADEPPDTPRSPFPYRSEDVTYPSLDRGVTIAGTVSIPPGPGPFPAVLLVAGSGPTNRDERIGRHKPFLVLADALARHGVMVLRSDKRGIGSSTGEASTADLDAYARDAAAGLDYLKARKEVDARRIGILGHSEGGLVAPMVAVSLRPRQVAWLVLMGAPAVPGRDLLLEQTRLIMAAEAVPEEQSRTAREVNRTLYDVVVAEKDPRQLRARLRPILEAAMGPATGLTRAKADARRATIDGQLQTLMSPWFRQFVSYDPVVSLEKLHCPVLALYGDLDLQVPPAQNLAPMQGALQAAKNPGFTGHLLVGHNHLLQRGHTGLPSEYETIPETMSPDALERICSWVLKTTTTLKDGPGPP